MRALLHSNSVRVFDSNLSFQMHAMGVDSHRDSKAGYSTHEHD